MFKTKEEKVEAILKSMTKEEKLEYLNGILSEEEKEELKKVDETNEEEVKEEPKKEDLKEEVKQEFDVEKFKSEIKEELKQSIQEQIQGLNFEEKFKPYVTKDELEEIKKDIPKAKSFGADGKNTSVEDNDFEKSRESILQNLN